MREIKFRAKAKFDNQWVYGFYVERDGYDKGMIYERNGLGHDVDPSTRCEYTGLKDKHGNEMYEGDIQRYGGINWEIRYNDGEWILDPHGGSEAMVGRYVKLKDYIGELIGDIYDNPELMEGDR